MDPYFTAVVEATEEAVLNSLVANEEMTGVDGHRSPALPRAVVRSRFARLTALRDEKFSRPSNLLRVRDHYLQGTDDPHSKLRVIGAPRPNDRTRSGVATVVA